MVSFIAAIAVHSGPFHCDDVIAVAVLSTLFSLSWVRTRNEEKIEEADFVVDVGREYAPKDGRFDHHQFREDGGNYNGPQREGGVKYASAGLVWEEYGLQYVEKLLQETLPEVDLRPGQSQAVVDTVDARFIKGVDGLDTASLEAEAIPKGVVSLSSIISEVNPTYIEQNLGVSFDEQFPVAVQAGRAALDRAIHNALAKIQAEDVFRSAESDRNFVGEHSYVFLEEFVPWSSLQVEDDVLYVVFPGPDGAGYRVQQVPESPGSFQGRKALPEEWAGKNGEDLAELIELDEFGTSTFCHGERFIAGTETKSDALKMVEEAIKA